MTNSIETEAAVTSRSGGDFAVEVGTTSCRPDAWSGNARTFDDAADAEQYARELSCRWLAVTRWRVIDMQGNVQKEVTL